MTTIAVVRKSGYAAIAADTLTKWGSGKESADYVANHAKIVKVGDTYIAGSGTSTFKLIVRDYFAQRGVPARFDTSIEIFKTWQAFHAALKDKYYLVTVGDKDDTIESSKFDVLLANPHGIFGVGAHRTVQEYRKFYAIGTGIERLSGSRALRSAVESGTVDALLVRWRRESDAFERAVEPYRLYAR